MPLNRHIHLDLPGPRSTSGHWLQSSIAETISLPGKNTKEELEELQEFKERSQEQEPRSQHAWVRRGVASTRVSRPDSICSMACFAQMGEKRRLPATTHRLAALLAYNRPTNRYTMHSGSSLHRRIGKNECARVEANLPDSMRIEP